MARADSLHPLYRVRALWRARVARWLKRRLPPASTVHLHHRNLFILPTRAGGYFGLCAVLILLTAINYQNNMGYALASLLLSLFVVAIAHTYRNLSGLRLSAGGAEPVFAGQQAGFKVYILNPSARPRFALTLLWHGCASHQLECLDARGQAQCTLHKQAPARGWYRPGRLCVETRFPLGLLRCWSLVDLDQRVLVYPAPVRLAADPVADDPAHYGQEYSRAARGGSEEFEGLRHYYRGDPLKYVHWNSLAKGQPLQSRYFSPVTARSCWLEWEQYPHLDVESRLSHLCALVLEYSRAGIVFGLRLPGSALAPDNGVAHREAALRALALFARDESL